MPYKSAKQRRYMHWAAEHGKIDSKVVKEFDAAERAQKTVKKEHKHKRHGGSRK